MCILASRPDLLCVGGEDHHLRIPFLEGLRACGMRVAAAGTASPVPFVQAGIDYWRIHFQRFVSPAADRAAVTELMGLLSLVRPRIVQSFDTKPNVLVPWAAGKVRGLHVVRTINGMGWVHSSRSPLALLLRPVQRTLHRRAGRFSDVTIFQNSFDKGYFERLGLTGAGQSVLIPGSGVDLNVFDREIAQCTNREQLRKSLLLDDAEVVITVSRLTRQKGIPTLLKAAALVHQVRPRARFILVGPRSSEGRLAVTRAEIERHAPYVTEIGPRTDIPALLRMADLFVLPSEYREGIPRVLLEAALAELPMVSTNVPGCDEVVKDGWNGRIVKQHAPQEMAAAILDLLGDRALARSMGTRAAQTVRARFGLEMIVALYRHVYLRCLASVPRSLSAGADQSNYGS